MAGELAMYTLAESVKARWVQGFILPLWKSLYQVNNTSEDLRP